MANATANDTVAIETMIDHIGLSETLNLVAAICAAKAQHIRETYDSPALAAQWDALGADVSEVADSAVILPGEQTSAGVWYKRDILASVRPKHTPIPALEFLGRLAPIRKA